MFAISSFIGESLKSENTILSSLFYISLNKYKYDQAPYHLNSWNGLNSNNFYRYQPPWYPPCQKDLQRANLNVKANVFATLYDMKRIKFQCLNGSGFQSGKCKKRFAFTLVSGKLFANDSLAYCVFDILFWVLFCQINIMSVFLLFSWQ